MNRHRDPTFATTFREVGKWPIHVQVSHYATIACRRLDRIGISNGKKQAKKPTDDEINQSRVSSIDFISASITYRWIFNAINPFRNHQQDQIFRISMFGNTLDEVMELQKDKYPYRKLPWIQVTLSQQVWRNEKYPPTWASIEIEFHIISFFSKFPSSGVQFRFYCWLANKPKVFFAYRLMWTKLTIGRHV